MSNENEGHKYGRVSCKHLFRDLSIYESFKGTPGHYSVGSNSVTGVLEEVNLDEGYMSFRPSIVGYGEAGVKLETERSSVLVMDQGLPIVFRPIDEEGLEVIAHASNEEVRIKRTQQGKIDHKPILYDSSGKGIVF